MMNKDELLSEVKRMQGNKIHKDFIQRKLQELLNKEEVSHDMLKDVLLESDLTVWTSKQLLGVITGETLANNESSDIKALEDIIKLGDTKAMIAMFEKMKNECAAKNGEQIISRAKENGFDVAGLIREQEDSAKKTNPPKKQAPPVAARLKQSDSKPSAQEVAAVISASSSGDMDQVQQQLTKFTEVRSSDRKTSKNPVVIAATKCGADQITAASKNNRVDVIKKVLAAVLVIVVAVSMMMIAQKEKGGGREL